MALHHTPRSSEAGHFYNRLGEPVWEVPSADGKKMVSPTIVHARKLGLLPGFTSVNRMLYNFVLERYKIRQGILAALTLPRIADETDDAYFKRLDDDRQAHARGRADEGKAIHAAIEQFLRGETYDVQWHAQVAATMKLLGELPEGIIIDYKTKESVEGKKDFELFFDDHIMQLAAYKHGYLWDGARCPQDFYTLPTGKVVSEMTFASPLGYGGRIDGFRKAATGAGMNNVCVSIIISVKEPGVVRHKVWNSDEEARGWEMFRHALALWQIKNRCNSGWTPQPSPHRR